MPAKLRYDGSFLTDFNVVQAGTSCATDFPGACEEALACHAGGQISDGAMRGDCTIIVAIARDSKCAVGQSKDKATMDCADAVGHFNGCIHGNYRKAGSYFQDFHTQAFACPVIGP